MNPKLQPKLGTALAAVVLLALPKVASNLCIWQILAERSLSIARSMRSRNQLSPCRVTCLRTVEAGHDHSTAGGR
jgi:hypothetical protein